LEKVLLLGPVGELPELRTLVIIQERDFKLDYESIFVTYEKLQRLSVFTGETLKHLLRPVSMERGKHGVVRRMDVSAREDDISDVLYLGRRWFNMEAELDSDSF